MKRFAAFASTALLFALANPAAAQAPADYRVIVVGSGYGGSVAAFNLGQAGVQTLVLERGRNWTVTDPTTNATFPTIDTALSPAGDPRVIWLHTTCGGNTYTRFVPPRTCVPPTTGLLERVEAAPNAYDASPRVRANGISALVPAAVGGGSVVNNGITYQPTKQGWDLAFPPAELPYMDNVWKDLDHKYFPLARERLAPEVIPADVLATPYYESTRLMDLFGAAMGYPNEDPSVPSTLTFGKSFTPVILDYDKVREEIAGTRVASAINGEVWWGINSGAKKSLDMPEGYLGRALATGHVELKALHTVTDVEYDPSTKLYTVTAISTDEAYNVLATEQYSARFLLMAAGSIGTTKLLVHARDTGALPLLNAHVGTRWSSNGNTGHLRFASAGFLPQGGTGGVKITDFAAPGNPVVLENLPQPVPPFFAAIPELVPFFGAMSTIGIGIPQAKGSFHYDAATDTVVLDWPATGAQNVYDRVTQLLTDPRMPGTPFILPMASAQATTLHPLGGVPLGLATDLDCQLAGYKGLYAVDGSLLPGPSAVANPSMTIAAMAERCMKKIVERALDFDVD
jgi:cholesterol oxidase